MKSEGVPSHLMKYTVEQDYSRYTSIDHAVWRHIMRQLKAFLSVHAHPIYVEGLEKTGISTERIPRISEMSEKLEKFGWRAIPVSGFIPPAAFMELQAHGILPIASDMRSVNHLMYTPAPDIVHEAAGHAPILVDPEFAAYLKKYAQVARKAIISKQDLQQYEAIRVLSDVKEDPTSTPEQIRESEQRLSQVNKSMSFVSEAGLLSRMNWWTAEYGLIGSVANPKIYGAGLLSSVGESRECITKKVRRIPLSVDCVTYTYDITEPQPQLFVTPSFVHLSDVLEDLAKQMAFRRGGKYGLDRAIEAGTVNTVELNSGLQISGQITKYLRHSDTDAPTYLQFTGPTQLSYQQIQLSGHDGKYHHAGFGSPVGYLRGYSKCLSTFSESELKSIGIKKGQQVSLKFASDVEVQGDLFEMLYRDSKLLVMSFKNCRVKLGTQLLFDPEWGVFDMAVGSSIPSVFGGPADRDAYGDVQDFAVKYVPKRNFSTQELRLQRLYQMVRDIRERQTRNEKDAKQLREALKEQQSDFPNEWLLNAEILELSPVVGA